MKCSYCGKQMKDDHVFCEHCGKERHLVPVFEPEIEASIQETLTGIVDDFNESPKETITEKSAENEQTIQTATVEEEHPVQISDHGKKRKIFWYLGFISVGLLILIILGLIFLQLYHRNSYDYQIAKATESFVEKDYEESIQYTERAIEIASNSSDAKMMLANCYIKLNREADAIFILEELIANDNAYQSAYKTLIALYEKKEEYEEINELLRKCKENSILEKYQSYIAFEPEFSQDSGSYDELVSLKLMAAGTGNIYYSVNGDDPTAESQKYTAPIRMETGEYTVKAVFINGFNISSDVVEKKYKVEIEGPDEPQISVDSGAYTVPGVISVEIPDGYSVYYTTDHTEPTMDSTPYTGPIPMPMGNSQYKFIMYSEDGVASKITTREYQLTLQSQITIEESFNLLRQSLITKGELLDFAGHIPGVAGTKDYECTAAFTEQDQVFYLIVEYYVEPDGSRSKTGNFYAVNISTRELYRAVTDYDGYYMVEAF